MLGEWALSMVGVEEGHEFRFREDLYFREYFPSSLFYVLQLPSTCMIAASHTRSTRLVLHTEMCRTRLRKLRRKRWLKTVMERTPVLVTAMPSCVTLLHRPVSSDRDSAPTTTVFFTPVLNSQGMKKLCYAVQKSSWNEPCSSSSFTVK